MFCRLFRASIVRRLDGNFTDKKEFSEVEVCFESGAQAKQSLLDNMGKGVAKFGGKSGSLPIPKTIFKQPFKHEVYKKPVDSGYVDGILHPKSITRNYIQPKVFTPEHLLKKTAAEPTKKYTEAEIEKMPTSQQFKIKNAEMRRKYLKESYETEVKRLERKEEKIKSVKLEEESIAAEKANHKESKATIFTSPTIESYLEGPLVRQRTEEENELLAMKRHANRLQAKLDVDTERATRLLQLYNASSSFAITQEKLEKLVDAAFDSKADQTWTNIASATPNKISAIKNDVTFDYALVDIVLDNVNTGPGYDAVNDYLDGFTDDITELAQQIKEEKNAIDLQAATENLNKISENSNEEKI